MCYSAAVSKENGLGSPVSKAQQPRPVKWFAAFDILRSMDPFWRAVRGIRKGAPVLARSSHLHGLPPLLGSEGAGFNLLQGVFMSQFQDEDEPVVMHDELRELLVDASAGYCAVTALVSLLRGESPDMLDSIDRRGLADLMGHVKNRMELTLDGLVVMAVALGLPDARDYA